MAEYFELSAERSNILIVDDDLFVCEMLSEHLRASGYRTFMATSLDDAKHLLTRGGVDFKLIILDYQLGSELGMSLIVGDNQVIDVGVTPVIMLSAHEDPAILEESFFHGISDYVIKPVNLTLLTLKIRIIIDSMLLKNLVIKQNDELSRYIMNAEREEAVAKFTYEYLVKNDYKHFYGVNIELIPCSAFSGDIFLVKNSPNGDINMLLADATGHGLSAAITIMPVVSAFNTMVAKGFHLERIVTEINKKMITDTPEDRFVATTFIQIKKEQNEIAIWNGAMPPLYVVKNGEIKYLIKSQHMALGIVDDDKFDPSVMTISIHGDEHIFAFTDGLYEQKNAQGKTLAANDIVNVIKENPQGALNNLKDMLIKHAGRNTFDDDVELLSYCPLDLNAKTKKLESSEFDWSLRLAGKSLANCEPSQLANQFLQTMGVNQPLCQRTFLVMTEMLSNALEHGVLKLDSELKASNEGFFEYYEARKNRLTTVTEQDWVELSFSHKFVDGSSQLSLQVVDSGSGYEIKKPQEENNDKHSGRGLGLIRSLTKNLEVKSPGNFIKATIQ
jgi:two-component system, HptB-dependent secretion and biofilm response regulator